MYYNVKNEIASIMINTYTLTFIPSDLTEGAKSMTLSEDSEKNEKQRMDLFYAFLKQRADAGDVEGTRAISDILHEVER